METTLRINGMTCSHCVSRITFELRRLTGVQTVSINLDTKTAHISFAEEHCDKEKITQVIEELGYKVIV